MDSEKRTIYPVDLIKFSVNYFLAVNWIDRHLVAARMFNDWNVSVVTRESLLARL